MKKNYNFMALQGIEIDDQDYVDEFGVPPELAYTPELNYFMINKVFEENVVDFMKDGMSEPAAIKKAGEIRDRKRKEVRELMAQKGMLNG
mgnify:CR=1 FL=1